MEGDDGHDCRFPAWRREPTRDAGFGRPAGDTSAAPATSPTGPAGDATPAATTNPLASPGPPAKPLPPSKPLPLADPMALLVMSTIPVGNTQDSNLNSQSVLVGGVALAPIEQSKASSVSAAQATPTSTLRDTSKSGVSVVASVSNVSLPTLQAAHDAVFGLLGAGKTDSNVDLVTVKLDLQQPIIPNASSPQPCARRR